MSEHVGRSVLRTLDFEDRTSGVRALRVSATQRTHFNPRVEYHDHRYCLRRRVRRARVFVGRKLFRESSTVHVYTGPV